MWQSGRGSLVADEFTDREMYEQASGNMVALTAALHEFLKQKGLEPSAFWSFFGETYAPSWAEDRGDLTKVAYYVAPNMTSIGCTTETTHEDGKVTVKAKWPGNLDDPDLAIPPKPALVEMSSSFESIMSRLGINFSDEETSGGMVFHLAE
jgi:hypothetical protein